MAKSGPKATVPPKASTPSKHPRPGGNASAQFRMLKLTAEEQKLLSTVHESIRADLVTRVLSQLCSLNRHTLSLYPDWGDNGILIPELVCRYMTRPGNLEQLWPRVRYLLTSNRFNAEWATFVLIGQSLHEVIAIESARYIPL